MSSKQFHEIFKREVDAISKRRAKHGRPPIELEEEDRERDKTPVMRPTADSAVIGLALSGGGIRSAAFCLGVLQALDARREAGAGIIDKVDYFSTVSGGGYIGTSMTAAMSAGTAGKFPFASELRTGEVAGVQHIRDHSNYLFPQGAQNIFGNVVVYLRGIAANVVLVLPWLLFAAALTIFLHPDTGALYQASRTGLPRLPIWPPPFGLTLEALLLFFLLLAAWALWRSTPWGRGFSDVGFGARVFAILLVIVLLLAFIELQPPLLYLAKYPNVVHSALGGIVSWVISWAKWISGFFAAVGTVVGFLGRFLADSLKRNTETSGVWAFVTRIWLKLLMYVAGAALPALLWIAYLYLSFLGIKDCGPAGCEYGPHTPHWLATLAGKIPFGIGSIALLYLIVWAVLLFIGWLLTFSPNANSLHRLYRDRLSKAFLFDPTRRMRTDAFGRHREVGAESDPAFRNDDLVPLEDLKVSKLNPELAPYHLINTALNIEASKYANRRGRNADFFIFSPLFTGSVSTGYVETERMEHKKTALTAGTAMAVSGAAASANMGSATIKPLTPTLAILNVRLGYWLDNPAKIAEALNKSWVWRLLDKLYFLNEMLGLLTETSETVFLTDGGHIENLGIYELLRRRCKLIIAVDAEADPDMAFGSLVNLQRYARIDFGLRIDLPWAAIRDATRKASKEVRKTGGLPQLKAAHGPHCALGTIYYPRKHREPGEPAEPEENNTGLLLYIKASFTGDENDYVVEYKRRNPDFPHETTVDQLFTESQFEAYRNLGFHAVNSAFKPSDLVSMTPDPVAWMGATTTLALEQRLRSILGWKTSAGPAQT